MDKNLAGTSPYKATLTREQFLFHEMRITARLKCEGLTDAEIVEKIMADNLFQYPTEKSVKRMAQNCITRLNAMGSEALVKAIAEQPADVSKQICLYAMMKNSRLVWDSSSKSRTMQSQPGARAPLGKSSRSSVAFWSRMGILTIRVPTI